MTEYDIIKINRLISRINEPLSTAERERALYIIADIFEDFEVYEWAAAIRSYLREYADL